MKTKKRKRVWLVKLKTGMWCPAAGEQDKRRLKAFWKSGLSNIWLGGCYAFELKREAISYAKMIGRYGDEWEVVYAELPESTR